MKSIPLLMISLALLAGLLNGCSGDEDQIRSRLDRTIRDLDEHRQSQSDNPVLAALKRATPKTLETPELVYCRVYASDRNIRLWLEWIANEPDSDAVLIRNAQNGDSVVFSFDPIYLAENEKLSESSVLFRFVRAIEADSEMWKDLHRQIAGGNTEAVLLLGGKEISNTVQVRLMEALSTEPPSSTQSRSAS